MKLFEIKSIIQLLLVVLIFQSCNEEKHISSINPNNWEKRFITSKLSDSLVSGSTYLSVYSQIYSETENRIHDLTATVSMRNMSRTDTVYIERAEFYDTSGEFIRNYFKNTIFISPMETVEIVIDERDKKGGTGANFMFDWKSQQGAIEPYFEAVMISTYGQQGLSFTTQGKRVK